MIYMYPFVSNTKSSVTLLLFLKNAVRMGNERESATLISFFSISFVKKTWLLGKYFYTEKSYEEVFRILSLNKLVCSFEQTKENKLKKIVKCDDYI